MYYTNISKSTLFSKYTDIMADFGTFTKQELINNYVNSGWIDELLFAPTIDAISNKLFEAKYINGEWVTYITARGMSISMYVDMTTINLAFNEPYIDDVLLCDFIHSLCKYMAVEQKSLMYENLITHRFIFDKNGNYILNTKYIKMGYFGATIVNGCWATTVSYNGVSHIRDALNCKLGRYKRLLNYIQSSLK